MNNQTDSGRPKSRQTFVLSGKLPREDGNSVYIRVSRISVAVYVILSLLIATVAFSMGVNVGSSGAYRLAVDAGSAKLGAFGDSLRTVLLSIDSSNARGVSLRELNREMEKSNRITGQIRSELGGLADAYVSLADPISETPQQLKILSNRALKSERASKLVLERLNTMISVLRDECKSVEQ